MTYLPRAGDVMVSRTDSWLAKAIRWGEIHEGDEKVWANHTAVIISPDPDPLLIESRWPKVRCALLSQSGGECRIYRPPDTYLPEELHRACYHAMGYVGEPYGVLRLFGHIVDNKVFGGLRIFRRLPYLFKECSRLVDRAYRDAGLWVPWDKDPSPDDIEDGCLKAGWELVHERSAP